MVIQNQWGFASNTSRKEAAMKTMWWLTMCFVGITAMPASSQEQRSTPEATACLKSEGEWDERIPAPHCVCPEPRLVNWLASKKCPRHDEVKREDICVEPGGTKCGGGRRVVETRIREVPVVPKAGLTCQQICEQWGDQAHWVSDAPTTERCQPVDEQRFAAGPCDLRDKPIESDICQKMCTANGGVWTPTAPEEMRCQPTDPARFMPARCGFLQRPVVAHDTMQREERTMDIPRLHFGIELVGVGFGHGDVSAPFSAGAGFRFRGDLLDTEYLSVLAHAGVLWNGRGGDAKNTPVGTYLRSDLVWFPWTEGNGWHLGFGGGAHLVWVATDRFVNSILFEYGGHGLVALRAPIGKDEKGKRRALCLLGLAPGLGRALPYERNVFVGFITVECDNP